MSERRDAHEPGSESTAQVFSDFVRTQRSQLTVLNCAIPLSRAKLLTDIDFPAATNLDACLVSSGSGRFPQALVDWKYEPRIQTATQLPNLRALPPQYSSLKNSPFFASPSQALGQGRAARHVRYHHDLWHELKPKTLRGVHTTLVFATPQIGFCLEPHIKLDKAFCYIAALARAYGPAQLLPASYLYPDAQLGLDPERRLPFLQTYCPTPVAPVTR